MTEPLISVLVLIVLIIIARNSNKYDYIKKSKYLQIILLSSLGVFVLWKTISLKQENSKIFELIALMILFVFGSISYYKNHIIKNK